MPAVSQAQQKFMGMVHAAQKGKKPASPEVAKAAKSMTKKAAHDFAATPRKGLPKKVKKENKITEAHNMREDAYEKGPRTAPTNTYQTGVRLSKKVRTSTNAMASNDRDDMDMQRPVQPSKEQIAIIEDYNEYGAALREANKMRELAEKLSRVAEAAETFTMNETGDDWFDKHTTSRNMKEIKRYAGDFGKLAEEADVLHERMTALYDDMGNILQRYFEIHEPAQQQYTTPEDPQNPNVQPPSDVEEASLSKPYQCGECQKRLTQAQAERAMHGDSGCPGCGGTDIDVSSDVDEIKDMDWLTTKDPVKAVKPRNVQDAEDRRSVNEDDDYGLPIDSKCPSCGHTKAVDLGKRNGTQFHGCLKCNKTFIPNAGDRPNDHGSSWLDTDQQRTNEIADDKYMTNSDRVLARKPRNVQDSEDRGKLTEVDTTQDDINIAQSRIKRANKIAATSKSDKQQASAREQARKQQDALNKIRSRASKVEEGTDEKSMRKKLLLGRIVREIKRRMNEIDKPKKTDQEKLADWERKLHGVGGKSIFMNDSQRANAIAQIKHLKDKIAHGGTVRKENAMLPAANLGSQKITQKQWDKEPAGAKVTIGGKKGVVRPAGMNPETKDIGGGSYVQPVDIKKREDDEVGSDE